MPAAPLAFDPKNPATWGSMGANAGFNQNVSGTGNFGANANSDDAAAAQRWENGQSGNRPWETRGASAADTRNNFYYGGSQGGAGAFTGQVGATQQQLGNQFGMVNGVGQTLQADAGRYQGNVNARDPGQFLDPNSIANNGADRANQLNAYGQLNAFAAAPMGPSAAQATLANATNANQANELAMARSGRGLGMSQANLHNAMVQNAGIQQNSANQAAILNAQEVQQHQANQLNAFGQLGGIANQMRTGDVQQGSYVTGSQQGALNANDQAALGYGQQQLGAGQLQLGAVGGNASQQIGMYGIQNDVNKSNLNAGQNYEQNLQNYYLPAQATRDANKGTDYSPYLAAGGAVLGAVVGGPGGAVAGGAAGSAIGQATK